MPCLGQTSEWPGGAQPAQYRCHSRGWVVSIQECLQTPWKWRVHEYNSIHATECTEMTLQDIEAPFFVVFEERAVCLKKKNCRCYKQYIYNIQCLFAALDQDSSCHFDSVWFANWFAHCLHLFQFSVRAGVSALGKALSENNFIPTSLMRLNLSGNVLKDGNIEVNQVNGILSVLLERGKWDEMVAKDKRMP